MRFATLVLLPLLANHAPTQSLWTSPPGFERIEAGSHSYRFAAYPDHRVMLFDGEDTTGTRTVKSVAFRLDYSVNPRAAGRVWSNVSLDVSRCNLSKLSPTFSSNPTSTPARVFSAIVTWPSGTAPKSMPSPWSNAYAFPFRTPFARLAGTDTCLDFDFRGGTLNSRPWPSRGEDYALDGVTPPRFSLSIGPKRQLGGGGLGPGPGCLDSALKVRGFFELETTVYKSGPFAGRATLGMTSWATAPNKPVVHAFGFRGNDTGWIFPGVTCNRLYVDPNAPTIFLPHVARRVRPPSPLS